jgi:hypothetical protein
MRTTLSGWLLFFRRGTADSPVDPHCSVQRAGCLVLVSPTESLMDRSGPGRPVRNAWVRPLLGRDYRSWGIESARTRRDYPSLLCRARAYLPVEIFTQPVARMQFESPDKRFSCTTSEMLLVVARSLPPT